MTSLDDTQRHLSEALEAVEEAEGRLHAAGDALRSAIGLEPEEEPARGPSLPELLETIEKLPLERQVAMRHDLLERMMAKNDGEGIPGLKRMLDGLSEDRRPIVEQAVLEGIAGLQSRHS